MSNNNTINDIGSLLNKWVAGETVDDLSDDIHKTTSLNVFALLKKGDTKAAKEAIARAQTLCRQVVDPEVTSILEYLAPYRSHILETNDTTNAEDHDGEGDDSDHGDDDAEDKMEVVPPVAAAAPTSRSRGKASVELAEKPRSSRAKATSAKPAAAPTRKRERDDADDVSPTTPASKRAKLTEEDSGVAKDAAPVPVKVTLGAGAKGKKKQAEEEEESAANHSPLPHGLSLDIIADCAIGPIPKSRSELYGDEAKRGKFAQLVHSKEFPSLATLHEKIADLEKSDDLKDIDRWTLAKGGIKLPNTHKFKAATDISALSYNEAIAFVFLSYCASGDEGKAMSMANLVLALTTDD